MRVTMKGLGFVVRQAPVRGFLYSVDGGLTWWAETMDEVCAHINSIVELRRRAS